MAMIEVTNLTGGNQTSEDRNRLSDQTAGRAVLALAVLYALHCIMVLAVVAPDEKRTPINLSVGILVSSSATLLSVWAGMCVCRGGRLFGAVVLAVLFFGAAALSTVLAAASILHEHAEFLVLDIVMATWAVVTLAFLLRAHNARVRNTEAEEGSG